ncbi:hypothetical protein LINPERPRIM_LOCUS15199 [Linum perenne]
MSRKLPQLWAKKGRIQVCDVGWGYYVVKFDTVGDYEHAMFGGPWMVGDHYVVIQDWRPYFQPEDSPISTLRVWVRLPGVPLEYFDAAILTIIGNRIGKTVRLDLTTLGGSRSNFARICVEVDLSKPLLSKYRLRRRVRRIEYEGLHTICYSCGCFGHVQDQCMNIPEEDKAAAPGDVFSNPIFQNKGPEDPRPEVEEDFGPWMKVTRAGRRGKKSVVHTPAPTSSSDQPRPRSPVSAPAVAGNSTFGNKFNALIVEDIQGDDVGTVMGDKEGSLEDDQVMEDPVEGNKENAPSSFHSDENVSTDPITGMGQSPMEVECGPKAQSPSSLGKVVVKVDQAKNIKVGPALSQKQNKGGGKKSLKSQPAQGEPSTGGVSHGIGSGRLLKGADFQDPAPHPSSAITRSGSSLTQPAKDQRCLPPLKNGC